MSEPTLTLDAVNKIYGGTVHAVKDVAMSVEPGEIVALLGSSGCGKTSTLRMIAGFEEVTSGSIWLKGRKIQSLPPAKRNVAMAFEGYSLYPPLTVRENIDFALRSAGMARAEADRKVQEIAHLLSIEEVLERYPASISGGQQQRASLGRALVREADLHLLDEPMGQLEPRLRALLRGRIKHFIKELGRTTILVTHDQTEANALADRIAVMEAGLLQQFATPEALKERPANLFTGTFIGEPPMNVLSAVASRANGGVRFELERGLTLSYPASDFNEEVLSRVIQRRHLVLGVRPHAVRLTGDGAPATVMANQWLGDQTHVAATFAGSPLVAVEHDRTSLAKGEQIGIAFDPSDLHLFDPETGVAFAHGNELA
ncbi:MAG: ABC transporter ATP-binding protein [Geminicoccaceae bacterium]